MTASSPSIQVWGGPSQRIGRFGHATRSFRILGRASSPRGIDSVSFAINGQGRFPTALGPSAFRLAAEGDFCIEFDRGRLRGGDNTVRIWAVDRDGVVAEIDVGLHLDPSTRWPLPFAADWSAVSSPLDLCEVVDGLWAIEPDGLRTSEPAYDRLVAIGDVRWRLYEVTVPFTLHALDRAPRTLGWPSMGPAFGVQVRFQGHHDWGDIRPARGWFPFGAMARLEYDPTLPPDQMRFRLRGPGFIAPLAQEAAGRRVEPGMTFVFKVRSLADPDGRGRYAAKLWMQGEPEPPGWTLEARGLENETPAGAALLMAHHADVTIGAVRAEPLG